MKVRTLKYYIHNRMLAQIQLSDINRIARQWSPVDLGAGFNVFWEDLMARQAQRQLVEPEPEVEAAKIEYVVTKVSTGEVIDTFDQREDAVLLIKKHVRQKKAKLTLLPAAGVHPLTEEEMAA